MEIPPSLSIQPDKKLDFFEQYRWPILSGLVVILAVGIYLMFVPPAAQIASGPNVLTANSSTSEEISDQSSTSSNQIVVDIAGGIKQPGVYYVSPNSIVEDVITAGGGFSATADLDAVARGINRAEQVTNHGKIYIPKKGESNIVYTNPSPQTAVSTNPAQPASSLISINTASATELELLPTIGPVLAQRIIDYRILNGPFQNIEAIQEVDGISENRFNQLKDFITI